MNITVAKNVALLVSVACIGIMLSIVDKVQAGSFMFANDVNGLDVVTHSQGYTSFLTPNPSIHMCIVPGTPNAQAMEVSVQNAITTINRQTTQRPNSFTGANNSIPSDAIDFESVILHELGHCVGLGDINMGSSAGSNASYTKSTDGANNVFTFNSGPDEVLGSADDDRGDDGNLHWFVTATNDPFSSAAFIDSTVFSRNLADLPVGDSFAASANKQVGTLLGYTDSQAVMTHTIGIDEAVRAFVGDGANTLKFAMTGLDELANTWDDYAIRLVYSGVSNDPRCDITVSANPAETSLATCSVSGQEIAPPNHVAITAASITYDDAINWYFNPVLNGEGAAPPLASFFIPTPNQRLIVGSLPKLTGMFDDTATGGSGIASGQYVLRDLATFKWISRTGSGGGWDPRPLTLPSSTPTSADWELSLILPVGDYRVYVRGTDTAENRAWWSSADFSIIDPDRTPPASHVTNPTPGATLMTPATLTGVIDDTGLGDFEIMAAQFLLRDLSTFDWIDANGNTMGFSRTFLPLSNYTATSAQWELTVSLSPGNYRFYVRGSDSSGNYSTWTIVDFSVISSDGVAPEISMAIPTPGQSVSSPLSFSGIFDDTNTGNSNILNGDYLLRDLSTFNWVDSSGNIVAFNPSLVTLGDPSPGLASWNFTASLNNGNYRVYVRGRDDSNNLSTWLFRDFEVLN